MYHGEEHEERLLEVQSTHEIAQLILPFVNEAGPSNAEATPKPMEFCEGAQGVQTLALQLANEETNPRIQRVSPHCWHTWKCQGICGVQHDARVLMFPIVVHLVSGEEWHKDTSKPPSPNIYNLYRPAYTKES